MLMVGVLLASTMCVKAGVVFDTGNDYLSMCEDPRGQGHCSATAVGYADMLSVMGYFCADRNVKKGQMKDVVLKYVRDHPEKRQIAAASLAFSALTEAFPCKN